MVCPHCAATVSDDRRYCTRCGGRLDAAAACVSCGSPLGADDLFCGECGRRVDRDRPAGTVSPPRQTPRPSLPPAPLVSERRRCSVLFVDLVGFTEMSETRDVEEVGELLAGYFALARTVVRRYGGLLEKFIGDAVMAVWGAPTAHDDDSERAVRAAMEIVESVRNYGVTRGLPLQARAGVVTDSVAVTVGAEGQGMVAGDPVNTAARVQSVAEPETVYVDKATRQASEAAIAYADAGRHQLKGKADPMHLYRAVRVVAGLGGNDRVDGLEPGFVGRERELRLIKENFHAAADTGRATLVSVVGLPGVGKTRMKWEFEKYIDGLADTVLWHDGRCLPYGDGVAFWALAQMVRHRLGIPEDDAGATAAQRLEEGLRRWVPDESERAFLTPRLGALLGTSDHGLPREELFSGWRLWFERLAEQGPVVLVVDDVQWADPGLLDFCEHLLEWGTGSPLFLLTLGRPEVLERRPGWGSGRRAATALGLDPLPSETMRTVLDNLVPDLPPDARERIVTAADGVPLYAVELVRALVDRDVIQPQDGSYRLVGEVTDIAVPASLASLITSRIDGLSDAERTLVGGLAVLGSTFPRTAIPAVSRLDDHDLDALISSLIRREILTVRSERLSPERGQYAFTQTLMRAVAYDTLSRRDRRARHLDVARHLRETFPEDGLEVIEVVAEHYRDAYLAVPDAPDADEVRRAASKAFTRAGRRLRKLGAPESAVRAHRTAAELAGDDPAERARCLQRAGEAAELAGQPDTAAELLDAAAADYDTAGQPREAAWCRLERIGFSRWRILTDSALAEARAALPLITDIDDKLAVKARTLVGTFALFSGQLDEAFDLLDRALARAQALGLPKQQAVAATLRGISLEISNRSAEAMIYFSWAIDLATEHDLKREELDAQLNAGDSCMTSDLPGAREHGARGIALARSLGNRPSELLISSNLVLAQIFDGDWDAAATVIDEYLGDEQGWERTGAGNLICRVALLSALRGDVEAAREAAAAIAEWSESREVQSRMLHSTVATVIELVDGQVERALATGLRAFEDGQAIGVRHEATRVLWPATLEAALRAGRKAEAGRLIGEMEALPAGILPPYLKAELAHYRARLAASTGADADAVEADYADAEQDLRRLGYPYFLARVLADHGAWLQQQGRADEAAPLLVEARQVFGRLGARPALAWLERDTGLLALAERG